MDDIGEENIAGTQADAVALAGEHNRPAERDPRQQIDGDRLPVGAVP
jgi:hypothetical protein